MSLQAHRGQPASPYDGAAWRRRITEVNLPLKLVIAVNNADNNCLNPETVVGLLRQDASLRLLSSTRQLPPGYGQLCALVYPVTPVQFTDDQLPILREMLLDWLTWENQQ